MGSLWQKDARSLEQPLTSDGKSLLEGEKLGHVELDVSIVIPCLNEEKSVAGCVREGLVWLTSAGLRGEVVVVDNGSTDRSAELATQAGARVVNEPRRGKGNAVRRAMTTVSGRFVVLADADGTYDLRDLEPLIRPLRNGYDMVIGNRLRGAMEPKSMPWLHRRVGNPLFGALISLITRRRFGDCLSGLRAFRREAWSAMAPQASGFELESEMCLRAGRQRLRVTDVPVRYAVRQARSKLRGLTHGWAIARFIVLDSADIIFFIPAFLAVLVGISSLGVGMATTTGVEVGSVRWQPVFAGGVLVPGGIALMVLGLSAKWLAWRRGVIGPDWVTRQMGHHSSLALEFFLVAGIAALIAGGGIDAYLLWRWIADAPLSQAIGLGALAQTLVVSGLNLIVAAMLIGVLRAEPDSDPDEATDADIDV